MHATQFIRCVRNFRWITMPVTVAATRWETWASRLLCSREGSSTMRWQRRLRSRYPLSASGTFVGAVLSAESRSTASFGGRRQRQRCHSGRRRTRYVYQCVRWVDTSECFQQWCGARGTDSAWSMVRGRFLPSSTLSLSQTHYASARLSLWLPRTLCNLSLDYITGFQSVGCVAQLAERRSLAGELTLSCARPSADGWPLCG